MPAGRPSIMGPSPSSRWHKDPLSASATLARGSALYQRGCVSAPDLSTGDSLLPAPVTTPADPSATVKKEKGLLFSEPLPRRLSADQSLPKVNRADERRKEKLGLHSPNSHISGGKLEQRPLLAHKPQKHDLFDLLPLLLMVGWLTARGWNVAGRRWRARMWKGAMGQAEGICRWRLISTL